MEGKTLQYKIQGTQAMVGRIQLTKATEGKTLQHRIQGVHDHGQGTHDHGQGTHDLGQGTDGHGNAHAHTNAGQEIHDRIYGRS